MLFIIIQYILRHCYQKPRRKCSWKDRTVSIKAEECREAKHIFPRATVTYDYKYIMVVTSGGSQNFIII